MSTNHSRHNRTGYATAATLVVLLAGALYAVAGLVILRPESGVFAVKRCADFGTYEEALDALRWGAFWLDGDDDGEPCESLKK